MRSRSPYHQAWPGHHRILPSLKHLRPEEVGCEAEWTRRGLASLPPDMHKAGAGGSWDKAKQTENKNRNPEGHTTHCSGPNHPLDIESPSRSATAGRTSRRRVLSCDPAGKQGGRTSYTRRPKPSGRKSPATANPPATYGSSAKLSDRSRLIARPRFLGTPPKKSPGTSTASARPDPPRKGTADPSHEGNTPVRRMGERRRFPHPLPTPPDEPSECISPLPDEPSEPLPASLSRAHPRR